MATTAAAGQLDIFSAMEEIRRERPPQCLYDSRARGIPARMAEFGAWRDEYGTFGSLLRAHAWTVCVGAHSTEPTGRCQAATLSVDLRRSEFSSDAECDCLGAGALLYRGACRHCDWEGPPRDDAENAAAEDALDHAWPGWRDLPVAAAKPGERKAEARWLERVAAQYPACWLESAGPVRTWRKPPGTRHVPGYTPFGGYDVAVIEREAAK